MQGVAAGAGRPCPAPLRRCNTSSAGDVPRGSWTLARQGRRPATASRLLAELRVGQAPATTARSRVRSGGCGALRRPRCPVTGAVLVRPRQRRTPRPGRRRDLRSCPRRDAYPECRRRMAGAGDGRPAFVPCGAALAPRRAAAPRRTPTGRPIRRRLADSAVAVRNRPRNPPGRHRTPPPPLTRDSAVHDGTVIG